MDESDDFDTERSHDPDNGFLFFRYNLEIDALEGQRAAPIALLAQLIEGLWARGLIAVASCDYEDELPRNGHNSWSAC